MLEVRYPATASTPTAKSPPPIPCSEFQQRENAVPNWSASSQTNPSYVPSELSSPKSTTNGRPPTVTTCPRSMKLIGQQPEEVTARETPALPAAQPGQTLRATTSYTPLSGTPTRWEHWFLYASRRAVR